MPMLRKWMLSLVAIITVAIAGGTISGVHAQTPKPSTMSTKKLPARDAKGRFVKAASATPKPTKALPARDAKGRFVKSTPVATPKPTRKLPARDAKGRFVKTPATPKP